MNIPNYESLTVRLHGGVTYYFPAGAVLGDDSARVELLRDAIENETNFVSIDVDGIERSFNGSAVERYHFV